MPVKLPYLSLHLSFLLARYLGLMGLVILIVSLIRAFGQKLRTDFPILDVIIVAMTLTLPQLAAVPAQAMGWIPLGYQDPTDLRRTAVLVMLLILVSVAIGLAWDWRRWLKIAGLFLLIYIPLYTTFFTNPFGLFSGSLDPLVTGSYNRESSEGVNRGLPTHCCKSRSTNFFQH